jgi:hypothetical protein
MGRRTAHRCGQALRGRSEEGASGCRELKAPHRQWLASDTPFQGKSKGVQIVNTLTNVISREFTCIYSVTEGWAGSDGALRNLTGRRLSLPVSRGSRPKGELIHDPGLHRLPQWGASGIVACRNSPGYVIRVIGALIRSGARCCATGREAHHEFEGAHAIGRYQRSHASPVCRVRRGRRSGSPDGAGRTQDVPSVGLAAV